MKEMKKSNPLATKPAVAKPKLDTDPMDVAKRALTEARIDFKRVKEINAGPKTEKQVNPERAGIREKLAAIRTMRQVASNEIKAAKTLITEKRKECKLMSQQKRELKGSVKKIPRAAKNKAVEEARVALLEAELAYRKACLG